MKTNVYVLEIECSSAQLMELCRYAEENLGIELGELKNNGVVHTAPNHTTGEKQGEL